MPLRIHTPAICLEALLSRTQQRLTSERANTALIMEQGRLRARFVQSGVVAGLFGIAVFLAVDFLFAGALPSDSRALLGAVLGLGIAITYMRGVNERESTPRADQ